MTGLTRAFWVPVHVLLSVVALAWLGMTRRGRPAVFVHFQDVDSSGLDRQMGPLVDALTERGCAEIAAIPYGRQILSDWSRRGRMSVSLALIRCVPGMRGRAFVARLVLRVLRPSVLYLIDESGSGQPLVRAARALGIRTVGIQHGDVRPGVAPYDPGAMAAFHVVPVDVLCCWSEWFRQRLLAVSPIYDESNTTVTGRLRYPEARQAPDDGFRVALLADAGKDFAVAAMPYLEVLRSDPALKVTVCLHPADALGVQRALPPTLAGVDVVVGAGSSALLEALYFGCAVVVVTLNGEPDPAGLVREGLAVGCSDPADLVATCRAAARTGCDVARTAVWGADGDAVGRVLSV